MSGVNTIERLPSGVQGLDAILQGGFPVGGIHILQGLPGTGKTTLANQLCYRNACGGGRALYVTLLAESHARMLLHLGTMAFFDPSRLPEQVSYISGFPALEAEGLPGLVTLIRREVASTKANILVLDGLAAAEDRSESGNAFKTFIQELQTQVALYGCTAFLLTSAEGRAAAPPEHTMVDGIVELTDVRYGSRTERGLFVKKLRGSDYLPGRHAYRITRDGLEVYPRIEAALHRTGWSSASWEGRLSTGVESLDAMIGGGLPAGSTTGLLGPSGIGKTTLGLHFVAACTAQEPGLIFGFYDTPANLLRQAALLGLDLKGKVERGDAEIIWQPQGENIQDAVAHALLEAVARRNVKRLFLDGLGGFTESTVEPSRTSRFFSVLTHELAARGVTTVYTMETRDLIGPGIELPVPGISSLVENLIAMRFLEHQSRSRRLLSVVKIRGSSFDPALREFRIADGKGMVLDGQFEEVQELLSGFARDRYARR